MFERYTEKARRVIFFARYEACQLGSMSIESEHMLLGLMREDANLIPRFVRSVSAKRIREEVAGHAMVREKISTSIDLPDRCRTGFRRTCSVSWKFKKSAEFSDFLQIFYFSSGRFSFLAGDFVFQQIS
jgi:ATP-dependent Clp protease ATP-binding subunit ClpA